MNRDTCKVYCKLCPLQKGKDKNADVPTTDNKYTWSTLWQNSHRFHHRYQCLYIRKPTHSNYYQPFDRMAKIFSNSWQKGRHYCSCFYQQLSPHPHVSQIHTVWQWNGIQELNNGWCIQSTYIDHIFSAPYHSLNNRKLEVFHKYFKPTLKKLCENQDNWDQYLNQLLTSYHITPHLTTIKTPFFLYTIIGTHAAISQWPWIWMIKLGNALSCTPHSQDDIRWEQIQECTKDNRLHST